MSVLNPATLALSFWYRAAFASLPWAGVASAGGSGSKTLQDPGGGFTPTVGATLNGLAGVDCNGTQYLKDSVSTADTYITTTAYRFWMLVNIRTLPAPAGSIFNNPGLFTESGGNFGIVISSSGVSVYHSSAAVATKAITTGVHLVEASFNGATVSVSVDGGTPATGASVATGSVSAVVKVAGNFNNAVKADAIVYELGGAQSSLSGMLTSDLKAYINSRYALSL